MFIYQTAPVDWFTGMVPVVEAIADLISEGDDDGALNLIKFIMTASRLVSTAKGSYWEGDIRGRNIYVFGLPDPDACGVSYGLLWKQENNGSTFICSPLGLPWISQDNLLRHEK